MGCGYHLYIYADLCNKCVGTSCVGMFSELIGLVVGI